MKKFNIRELLKITFIIAMSGCTAKTFSFTAAPSPTIAPAASSTVQRLMPRTFVADTLNDTFGPSISTTVNQFISPVSAAFVMGGPCDSNLGDCPDTIGPETKAPLIPAAIAGRGAVMTRACDFIAATDSAIRYAVAGARNESLSQNFTSTTSADQSGPSTAELSSAYDLFYPGKTPSSDVVNSLATVAKSAATQAGTSNGNASLESWRFVFLTLCLAPDWQIP